MTFDRNQQNMEATRVRILALFVAISLLGPQTLAGTQSNFVAHPLLDSPGQWIWGAPTNGIVAGLCIERTPPMADRIRVRVYLREAFGENETPPHLYSEPAGANSGPTAYFGAMKPNAEQPGQFGEYFEPTNGFCGSIELRSSAGTEIPLRNPTAFSNQVYSTSFRLGQLGYESPFNVKLAKPLLWRLPLLGTYDLQNLFDLKEPGEYRLTILPKVYKRVKEDDDLCKRIDLPPLTVTVRFVLESGIGNPVPPRRGP